MLPKAVWIFMQTNYFREGELSAHCEQIKIEMAEWVTKSTEKEWQLQFWTTAHCLSIYYKLGNSNKASFHDWNGCDWNLATSRSFVQVLSPHIVRLSKIVSTGWVQSSLVQLSLVQSSSLRLALDLSIRKEHNVPTIFCDILAIFCATHL